MNSIRYIFGCIHEGRTVFSHTFFERGLRIPVAFCKDCIDNYNDSQAIKNKIILTENPLFSKS